MESISIGLRQPVPSGCYTISYKKKEILTAYLGTCVGVTLCDRKADVGGLIHLLLPEPTGGSIPLKPANYASTGLPLFLQTLCRQGAAIERLEASIAGGALVGPLSEADLDLDIGGRTVHIVEKILGQAGIPIRKTETGGFFSCQLSLDLDTWKSHIRPINVPDAADDDMDPERPTAEQLDKAIENICSVPQVVLKIIRMIQDDIYEMRDMAREIRQDQVLSARIIRLCNSAFFHKDMAIDSIDRALVLLGEKHLLQMVISAAFQDFFPYNGQGYSLCKGGLFNHALGTAILSQQLAEAADISPDIAYTAGLLHDIGKAVLDQYMSKVYPFFYRRTQENGDDLFIVEREAFGVTHDDVGSRLAERWSLPENLVDAIKHHHNPEKASHDSRLAHLVYLADLLMSRFMVGQELDRMDTRHLSSRLQKLGFKRDYFTNIIEKIPDQVFQIPYQ